MLDSLKKFNELPVTVKQAISSPEALDNLALLEKKYNIELAGFVMRVVVGDLKFSNLLENIISEFNLDKEKSLALEKELREKTFFKIINFLIKKPDLKSLPPDTTEFLLPKGDDDIFSNEDEKDIVEAKKLSDSFAVAKEHKIKEAVEGIAKEANISFPSESLTNRFKQIIENYLRGVREKIDIRETLIKKIVNGGVNLDPREADRILNIAQKKREVSVQKSQFSFSAGKLKTNLVPEQKVEKKISTEESYDLAHELKSGNISVPTIAPVAPVVTPVIPAKILPKIEKPKKVPEIIEKPKEVVLPKVKKTIVIPVEAPKAAAPETTNRMSVPSGSKKMMADIKAPQTMGPIDELAYMDLVNFRRLDENPKKRADRIFEKINLLGSEGLEKKLAGIKAWHFNPVNKTYLAMGQESMLSGKEINDIIKERKEKGVNYLSIEEFEAVMDLNSRLRF